MLTQVIAVLCSLHLGCIHYNALVPAKLLDVDCRRAIEALAAEVTDKSYALDGDKSGCEFVPVDFAGGGEEL
jgi:hypothetical protein